MPVQLRRRTLNDHGLQTSSTLAGSAGTSCPAHHAQHRGRMRCTAEEQRRCIGSACLPLWVTPSPAPCAPAPARPSRPPCPSGRPAPNLARAPRWSAPRSAPRTRARGAAAPVQDACGGAATSARTDAHAPSIASATAMAGLRACIAAHTLGDARDCVLSRGWVRQAPSNGHEAAE